jgi:hypothetical protein
MITLPKETENPKEIKEPDRGDQPSDINSPEVGPDGKATARAVSSYKQANSIGKRMIQKAKEGRIKTAAAVARKYGGEQPYRPADLVATGQTWRNNFTTHFLASIVDRAKPQLVDPIKEAKFLTYSSLPPQREMASEKSEKFRTRITKLIRSWSEWVNFIDIVAQENYLNGNCAPGYIDDDWRPKGWRFDEVYLPEGTGQHANSAPYYMVRQPILLHEFLRKIENPTAAEDAQFDLEGCAKAANKAAGLRQDADKTEMQAVDAWREGGSIGFTYAGDDIKVIWLNHLVVQEYDGTVEIWTTEEKEGYAIRHVTEFAEKMEETTTFFTLQTGNEKYYGSKGAGRMLANLHTAIERLRNLGSDQVILSGMPILQANETDLNTIQPVVRHPFILVPSGCTVAKEQVSFDAEAFEFMDAKLVSIAESIAGAFIPPNVDNGKGATTRIDAAQKAARELAVRNGVLGRFFQQFGELVGAMQKRICKPENLKEAISIFEEEGEKKKKGLRVIASKVYKWLKEVLNGKTKLGDTPLDKIEPIKVTAVADEEAVSCLVDMLRDGLTPQDIIELALAPAGNDVQDENPEEETKLLGYIAAKKQTMDPYVDQKVLTKMEAEAVLGEEGAKRVCIEDKEDPNVEAIAYRQQIIEFSEMMAGEQMPVAITDNHQLHRKTLLTKLQGLITSLPAAPTEETVKTSKLAVNHYAEHLQMDPKTPIPDKEKEAEALGQIQQVIADAEKALEDLAAQAEAAGVAGGPNAIPPQIPGQPVVQPPGDPDAAAATALEQDKHHVDTIMRANEQHLQSRKLDIEEKKLDLQDQHNTMNSITKTGLDIAKEAARANIEGSKDAESDLQKLAGAKSTAPKA